MDTLVDKGLSRMARWLGVAGVASIVFGATVLLWPGISLAALTALFGAFAFVYGVFGLGAGLSLLAHRSTEWVPYIVGGASGIVIGAITFMHPGATVLVLTYLIAAWAFVNGVFAIMAAVEAWGEKGAVWLAISGALSIVFGILVAVWPGNGLLAILWMVGLYAILGGITELIASYRVHQFHGEVGTKIGAVRPAGA